MDIELPSKVNEASNDETPPRSTSFREIPAKSFTIVRSPNVTMCVAKRAKPSSLTFYVTQLPFVATRISNPSERIPKATRVVPRGSSLLGKRVYRSYVVRLNSLKKKKEKRKIFKVVLFSHTPFHRFFFFFFSKPQIVYEREEKKRGMKENRRRM